MVPWGFLPQFQWVTILYDILQTSSQGYRCTQQQCTTSLEVSHSLIWMEGDKRRHFPQILQWDVLYGWPLESMQCGKCSVSSLDREHQRLTLCTSKNKQGFQLSGLAPLDMGPIAIPMRTSCLLVKFIIYHLLNQSKRIKIKVSKYASLLGIIFKTISQLAKQMGILWY